MQFWEYIDSQEISRGVRHVAMPYQAEPFDLAKPAIVGERHVLLIAPDAYEQLVTAGEEMDRSGEVIDGQYKGCPLTNLEMYALTHATRYGRDALVKRFTERLLAWIGVESNDDGITDPREECAVTKAVANGT